MRDGCAQDPAAVGTESARGHVCQGAVDEVGEDGFDDRVAAVGDVGIRVGSSVSVTNG